MRRVLFPIIIAMTCWLPLFATDAAGRMNLFVVGCFTPEFQDIFDADLDGYLLIGDDSSIDGAYLPRNYDNEIPDQDCDLPLRRSKDHQDYQVLTGTFFEVQFILDNTSTAGGGPLDISNGRITVFYPEGVIPHSASNPIDLGDGRFVCELGAIPEDEIKGTSVRFFASQPGNYTIRARVSTNLLDPNNNNNEVSATFDVVDPQSELVLPWISSNTQFNSQIVLNNYGTEDVLVWCSAVRQEGEFHARPVTIPARGFFRATTDTVFPELGQGSGYSVRAISSSPTVRGRWVTFTLEGATGKSPSQGVAIARPPIPSNQKDRSGQSILFGYLPISSQLFSAPVIVNLGDAPTDVTLEFFNQDGALLLSDNVALNQLESIRPFATAANNLLGDALEDVALVATSSGQPLTGVGFVFNQAGEPSIGNVRDLDTLPMEGGTNLILPWVSNNTLFGSTVVVNNLGDEEADITLVASRNFGNLEEVDRKIPAGGFLNESAASLFPVLGEGSGYTVQITSPESRLTGRWVTNSLVTASEASPSQGVGIRLDESDQVRFGTKILYGYLPITDGFTSAPVIVNVGDQPADVFLHFYDEGGTRVATEVLGNLRPFRPFAAVANNIVTDLPGDVYMVASSADQPLTGVAFVFNEAAEPAIGNVTRVDDYEN